ncbi:hypothetical protein FRC02_001547 [Tulasnella sp. 418]|nr:hypothetical protein FRC02_001547 [Tulasnella sp. 418]
MPSYNYSHIPNLGLAPPRQRQGKGKGKAASVQNETVAGVQSNAINLETATTASGMHAEHGSSNQSASSGPASISDDLKRNHGVESMANETSESGLAPAQAGGNSAHGRNFLLKTSAPARPVSRKTFNTLDNARDYRTTKPQSQSATSEQVPISLSGGKSFITPVVYDPYEPQVLRRNLGALLEELRNNEALYPTSVKQLVQAQPPKPVLKALSASQTHHANVSPKRLFGDAGILENSVSASSRDMTQTVPVAAFKVVSHTGSSSNQAAQPMSISQKANLNAKKRVHHQSDSDNDDAEQAKKKSKMDDESDSEMMDASEWAHTLKPLAKNRIPDNEKLQEQIQVMSKIERQHALSEPVILETKLDKILRRIAYPKERDVESPGLTGLRKRAGVVYGLWTRKFPHWTK